MPVGPTSWPFKNTSSSEEYLLQRAPSGVAGLNCPISLAQTSGDTGSATIFASFGMCATIHSRVSVLVSARESTRSEWTL